MAGGEQVASGGWTEGLSTGGGLAALVALVGVFVRAMMRTGSGYGALLDQQAKTIGRLEERIEELEAEVAALRARLAGGA